MRWGQHGEVGAGLRLGTSPWGSPRFQRAASRKLLSPFLVLVGSSDRRFPITYGRWGEEGAGHFWADANKEGSDPSGAESRGSLGVSGEVRARFGRSGKHLFPEEIPPRLLVSTLGPHPEVAHVQGDGTDHSSTVGRGR